MRDNGDQGLWVILEHYVARKWIVIGVSLLLDYLGNLDRSLTVAIELVDHGL
jgi:hypothetical protein